MDDRVCRVRQTAEHAEHIFIYQTKLPLAAGGTRHGSLRGRVSHAAVAALLAERGVRVDAWVREFAPLYENAARPFRRTVGTCWGVDET